MDIRTDICNYRVVSLLKRERERVKKDLRDNEWNGNRYEKGDINAKTKSGKIKTSIFKGNK